MKTLNSLDARYSVAREFNGARPHRVWVARFRGSYLGWSDVREDARDLARNHRRQFLARAASL